MSVAGQHQRGGQAAQATAEDDRVGHYPSTTSLRPFYSVFVTNPGAPGS